MDIAGMSGLTNYLVDSNKNSTEALEKQLNSAAKSEAAEEELLEACKQFEAYLWEQVLKEMEKTTKLFGSDDEEEGYAGNMVNTFKDTFIQEIATQLTESGQGANSLAQTLYEQMKRTYSAENL
ncbi:MAG: rod-binding protein [Bacillus sp. (in: Bacteria)]|nr:rod-binding protein [Bacillus sp. (in: firmicutes)]MCM1425242.1 rod-binding protein [Eubacterium sp.]